MNYKSLIRHLLPGIAVAITFSISGCQEKVSDELPNILWLTSEDNSPLLGCYGDEFATTPNLDKLASEALYNMGEKEAAKNAWLSVLEDPNPFARCHALNAIDCVNEKSTEIVDGVVAMVRRSPEMSRNRYDLRSAKWLMEKWQLNSADYDLNFTW